MKISVTLKQVNKKGNTSFEASANVDTGKGRKLSDVAKDVANFSKAIVTLQEKNAERGYASAVNGIKKSLPMVLTLRAGKQELTMQYRNYGKFIREATEANIRGFLEDNIDFATKYGDGFASNLKKAA